ncbi:hypothetical protein AWB74_07121 [Caballeronia arvi]|uniref:Uncharacterized protein n=1 Tax=Caballeronia arvi TaxID=1777135 RepID=A0A158KVI8_9BURK|nr:hypothetical protein AWB74_07121 [Caballeronia arvi]
MHGFADRRAARDDLLARLRRSHDAPEFDRSPAHSSPPVFLRVAYFVVKTEMPPFANWVEEPGWKGT